jgi:hypothetical protein
MLNKQSRTAEKGWFSSLVVGRRASNSSPLKTASYEMLHRASKLENMESTLNKYKNRGLAFAIGGS